VGASVVIRKLKKSGMTDDNGEFVLHDVPDGEYEVEISFVGYETRRTTVVVENHEGRVVADLKQFHSQLDETIVKGYYTTTNRLNTGNVTKIKGEDIQKQPVSDPIMALEGRVSGLYIQQSSGIPGASMIVRLRGQNSIANGNNPLYIVDGVPFTSTPLTNSSIGGGAIGYGGTTAGSGMSPFNNINPADIESIEVLKDADATAIYGSRGANGVILISTKKGKAGDSKFLANVYSGAGAVTRKMELLNTQQYLQVRHQAFINDGQTPTSDDVDINGQWDTTRYTDWQKVLIGRTAKFTNAQASLSGGNANTQFILGGGYNRQTTVFPGNYEDDKASIHLNVNHASANQKFHVLASAGYVNDNSIIPQADFTGNLNIAPDAPALYDANGNINWQNGTFNNPMAGTFKNARAVTNTLTGNLNLSYEIFHGLQVKSSFGYTNMQMNQTNQQSAMSAYGPPDPNNRENQFATSNLNTWIIEPQLDYSRKIGHGNLAVIVGTTHQQNKQNSIGQTALGFASDALIPNVTAANAVVITGAAQETEYHYVAFFGRINYNWEEKYLVNVTARRDGSSRFGSNNQFGNFGAVGAGWIFTKEKLIEHNLSFLSFGKLRASYGTTGNDQIGDYQFLSTYTPYPGTSYQGISTLYPTIIANPYFGWELVKKLEGGIELGFLKDRILLTASYYHNRTGNQLVGEPLPYTTGFNVIQANLPAVVQNTGTEVVLNTINIQGKSFTWSTSINLSIPRNKLISFPGLATNARFNRKYSIGKPLSSKPTYHYTGLNAQTGIYTFEDVNHDGAINSKDLQFLKQVTQNYYGGIQNSFSYKGWHLDFLVQFVKQTALNYLANFKTPGFISQNQTLSILNSWHAPGDNSAIQKYTQMGGAVNNAYGTYIGSDAVISDGSFIRLKNLSLAYTLPTEWQRKLHLQNTRIYIQGQNLLTITGYKGLDPETQGWSLPPLRMITGGIQVGL
jgi:TonB-linked SusC/RagA family outer membrane protein